MRTFLAYFDPKLNWVGLSVFPPATSLASKCNTPVARRLQLDGLAVRDRAAVEGLQALERGAQYELRSREDDQLRPGRRHHLVRQLDRGGPGRARRAWALGRPRRHRVPLRRRSQHRPDLLLDESPYRTKPCHQGVTSSGYSKSRGTIVYSIGYALGDDTGGCKSYTRVGRVALISVTSALQQIASNSGNFYNQPTPGQLNTIYTQIAADIGTGTSALTSDTTP